MSINWDVPLKNGKDVFFTEKSFNIFNNYVTFEERFLQRLEDHEAAANKRVEGVGSNVAKVPDIKTESSTLAPGTKESTGKQASSNKLSTDNRKSEKQNRFSKEDEAQSSLKLALNITKGRLPPPRKSSLCHEDQKLYLSLYSKYGGHSPADPTEEEITELSKLKVLQAVVKKEQEEYHKYSLSVAIALQAEYHYMEASARKYMEDRLTARRREIEMYPSHYNTVSSFTLKGTGQVSQLTYIKPLLQLGPVPKMIIPTVTYDRRHQLNIDTAAVSSENPIKSSKGKEGHWNHEACSMDENAEVLAVQHRAHIVISPGALMCLVDNHGPDYSRGWELPFSVKEYDVIEGDKKVRHRIVYIDKPFVSTNITERTKNTKFYKLLLRNIFCRHNSKDQSSDQSSGVDTLSRKTEEKRSKREEKESTDKQVSVSQLGDIFVTGKDSMEDVETFGTSSLESFKTKKKSETSNTVGNDNITFGGSGNLVKNDTIRRSNPSSRKVEEDSFNIFSDETVEDIETFGLSISGEKSTKKITSSKLKNKETGQIADGNLVLDTSVTLSTATESSSTSSLDIKQTPSSPVSQTVSTSISMVTGSTSAGSVSFSSNTDNPLCSVGSGHGDMGKLQSDHVSMETQTEGHVSTGLSTDNIVTKVTQPEPDVTIETPTENDVAMVTQQESHDTMETPTESHVSMETTNNNVTRETEEIHTSDKMCVESNGCLGLKEMPYVLIPIELSTGATAQGTVANNVAMDTNSDTDKTEHEVIIDAPASPVSMDTPSSPCITDSFSSPSGTTLGPKIIPLSVEKLAPQSYHSPDIKHCVLIPLEGEGNVNENIVMDHTQGNHEGPDRKENVLVSPPLPPRRSKARRSTTVPVVSDLVSDLDSDDDGKLLIDVSPVKDSDDEKADGQSSRQGHISKPKSRSNNDDGGKALEKIGSFYEKNTNKDGSGSTRVTRSRQSLDTIMAQMKSSSSVIDKQQRKKGDKMSDKIDGNESNSSNCESRNVVERCTRSRSLSETSRSSSEVKAVEVKSEFISCNQTLQTSSKAKSSVPESDSDSCIFMDVDVKDQSSKVKRRSSRLSTGSSSCTLEVKNCDRTVKASSKVKASEIVTNICPDVKSEETEGQSVVVRKRGRPRKIQPAPSSGSTTNQEEPRPSQGQADTEATRVEEDSISNPIPLKRKRGRPPKQKVCATDKPAETESRQTDDITVDNRSKGGQTGSKVKAFAAKSDQKPPTAEGHVSRVKPRMVATLIPRAENSGAKQTNTKKKDSGPKTGTKRLSSSVSTFDSILQGMQNMLHTPDQNVTGSHCPGPSEVSSMSTLMKQPDGQSNVSYHLWSLGGFQVVVRCGYHGTVRDSVQKLSKVHLCTKMEYQSSEGLEQITSSETCRSWISGYIRPHCKLLRARIDPLKSELIALEEIGLSQLIGSQQTFRPADAFLMLQNVFHKLHLQPPGQYLLHHGARDRNCNIKKCTDTKKRGSYDLHFQHFGFMTTNTPNNSVPWLPIDPSIILPNHVTKGRIPATFEPADYTVWIPTKKNKGKKKKKQTKQKQRV